ncbi:MAG: hypothetical protein GY794_26255, partial [bacterium]|nr:hypothetical protein [bacterium]
MMETYLKHVRRGIKRSICLICMILALIPVTAGAELLHDAYAYEDNFTSDSGLNQAESEGVSVSDDALVAETSDAVAISQCVALPQPEGAAFLGWSFLDVGFTGSNGAGILEVQDCSGNTLAVLDNLPEGERSLELSGIGVAAIRLRWTPNQAGAGLNYWRLTGRAEGVSILELIPNSLTPNSGDTITFTVKFASTGAVTRNPILRFSLDAINGLHTPDLNDGLAEDAEVDYGDGVNIYRPLEFVSASAGPNGEVPVTPSAGATSGEIVWELNDMSDGFADNVSVTLRIPKGYINGKTVAARSVLEHGSASAAGTFDNTMIEQINSAPVPVNSTPLDRQGHYSAFGNVGPGATNISDQYWVNEDISTLTNPSDNEDITVTITGIGSCAPLFRNVTVRNSFSFEIVRTPEVGQPFTESNPVIVHIDRGSFHNFSSSVDIFYDLPQNCVEGDSVGTQAERVVGVPAWSDIDNRLHPVVIEVCRNGLNYTHRIMSGNDIENYAPWPGWSEYSLRTGSSVRAGEHISTLTPSRTHTVPLVGSYNVLEVPEGFTFHGVRESNQLDRLYKDCTGTAPLPTDPGFDHRGETPHPAWKEVDISWSGPFTNSSNEYDPRAVVEGDCRLLAIKDDDSPAWQAPDYGNWRPTFLWRVCDGSYGCEELLDGAKMSSGEGTIYTYETFTDPAGAAHECRSYRGVTLYKEHASRPKVYAWPEENQVPAGESAQIVVNPENWNYASQYVDGKWAISIHGAREYIDFQTITGEVLTEGLQVPKPGQNVAGQSCNIGDILFHAPDSAACLEASSADDPACLAWWDVPDACQPPNGWGNPMSGNRGHDNYVPIYRFQLNAQILRTTPANTVLNFVAEVRSNDLSTRGADNAVEPERWPMSHYTANASVTVLELPGLDLDLNGPAARKPGDVMSYHADLRNIGNTPNNGWYEILWLPRDGVNNSEVTPEYQQLFVDRASDELLVEFSNEAACFSAPLTGVWTTMPLQASARSGYAAETVESLNPNAACLRIRRNPASSSNFYPGDTIRAALDVRIPNDPALEGQAIFSRALTGSALAFGATSEVAAVETVNVRTLISSDVVLALEKDVTIDPRRAGAMTWTLRVSNASGVAATNIVLEDELPLEVIYEGLTDNLPSGWQLLAEPNVGEIGGQLRLRIDRLLPDDGAPGN